MDLYSDHCIFKLYGQLSAGWIFSKKSGYSYEWNENV